MLRRGTEVSLRRIGALPFAIRMPPTSTWTTASCLYSDSLYSDPEPEEAQGNAHSAQRRPIPKEAFAFDPKKESFIKPMWVEEEGPGDIVWRAKVIRELFHNLKADSSLRYSVKIKGVSGMEEEPSELLLTIGELALGLDKHGIQELTSGVSLGSDKNELLVFFPTQEAKFRFLEATPTIEKIRNSHNEGRRLSVEMNEFGRTIFSRRFNPIRGFSQSIFQSKQHKFPLHPGFPDPSLDGIDAAKEWVRYLESELASYNRINLNQSVVMAMQGSTAPYYALRKREIVRCAEEVVETLNPGNRSFKEDISDAAIGRPHLGLPSDNFKNCLFIKFMREWVAKTLRIAASKAGEIPDPLNPGEKLAFLPLDSLWPRNSDRDIHTDSLVELAKRLNVVEAAAICAMNDYYMRSYLYYGRQEDLQRLFKARSFKHCNIFARRVLKEEFGLQFANRVSLEAGVLAPGTSPYLLPSKFALQITLLKGWEALRLSVKRKRILSAGKLHNLTSPTILLLKRNAKAVLSFLEERGTPATIKSYNGIPYILTHYEDGTATPTLYTRFGLTQKDFNRHVRPRARWGPQEADGVAVGAEKGFKTDSEIDGRHRIMLRRGAEVALWRVGALPFATRTPPTSTWTTALSTASRLYSDSLYLDPDPEEVQGNAQSAQRRRIPKEAFAFDPEKESFIKPMWVEEEGAEEIVWRAKVIRELLHNLRVDSSHRYRVKIQGVSGLKGEPNKLLSGIGQMALGLDENGIKELTSYVSRENDLNELWVYFSTQEAKFRFLDATPTIEKIRNSHNEGRHLSVEMTEFGREIFNRRFMPIRGTSQSMFHSTEYKFPLHPRFPDPSLDGIAAAKEWVRFMESELASYNKVNLNQSVVMAVQGSTAPYDALRKREIARCAEEIVETLNPGNRLFKEDISDATIGRPHWGLPSDNFKNCLLLTFRRAWVAKRLRFEAFKAGEIPDPLNQGEKLTFLSLDSLGPKNSDRDIHTDSLVELAKRLNRVETGVISAMNDYYRGSFIYYGRQEDLQRLLEARSFKQSNEFARRVLVEEVGLDGKVAKQLSLEAGVLAPGMSRYLQPSKFGLQIQLLKGWEADRLGFRRERILKGGKLDIFPPALSLLMKRNARAVLSFLAEGGTSAAIYHYNGIPYILTDNDDGSQTPTLYTRFGLTQEDFNLHVDPRARWGQQEADGVAVGAD